MGVLLAGAVVVAVFLAVVVVVRRVSASRGSADVDLGSVSQSWMSDQRGRKDS